MGLVCRPVQMYNEYVPAITGKRTWQYQVLGHHDGMDVGEPVCLDTMESFRRVCDVYLRADQSMDYTVQVYYGLHADDGKEEEFWDEQTLFTFVSFIQFKDKAIGSYNKYIEEKMYADIDGPDSSGKGSFRIRAYYSMDYNDSIVIIKSDRYETGMHFIEALHHNVNGKYPFEISNSYSVLAFDRNNIAQSGYDREADEIIDQVELRIVESCPGSIELLYAKLQEEFSADGNIRLDRYTLLGTDDGAIVIQNIPWGCFMSLYAADSGILCNSNTLVQQYAAAITTKIMYGKTKSALEVEKKEISTGDKAFCDMLNQYIKYNYSKKNNMAEYAEKKALTKIVNALGRIEYARKRSRTIVEYNFFTLFLPFYVFVELHTSADGPSNEYYDFLTYFNICTQNYDKPDRMSLQNADFNVRYFEMQTRYFTLYSAYIYRLKHLLNGAGSNKYEFVLCPGISERTEVIEFHKQEDDKYRLFKVEIAETGMYDIKSMLCVLGHEVAHFVGTGIRSRDNRYEHMLRINSRAIIIQFEACFENYGFSSQVCNSDVWKTYEEKLAEWISQYIDREDQVEYWRGKVDFGAHTEEIIEEYIQEYRKYKYYTENTKSVFKKAIKDMLSLQGKDIFEEIVWGLFEEALGNEEVEYADKQKYIDQRRMLVDKTIEGFIGERMEVTHAFNISRVLDTELYLLRECYADLISILVLRFSIKEYLDTIMKETLSAGWDIEQLQDTKIIARIAIVMVVMHHKDSRSAKYYRWTNEMILNDPEDVMGMELQNCAMDFMWKFIENNVPCQPSRVVQDSENIIYDHGILHEIILYLLHCRQRFYECTDEGRLEEIQAFKRVAEYDNVDEFYDAMMNLVIEYERDIYAELSETTDIMDKKIQKEQLDGRDTNRNDKAK